MSELKRFYLDATAGRRPEMVEDPDGFYCEFNAYRDLQSELAALREELTQAESMRKFWADSAVELDKRLTAAEQRNAELTKAISDAEYRADQGKVWNGMGWTYTGLHSHGQQKVLDILRTALKPTESGASE